MAKKRQEGAREAYNENPNVEGIRSGDSSWSLVWLVILGVMVVFLVN